MEQLNEYEFWRNTIAEKLESGELEKEGPISLDEKIQRIYALGYYTGRLDAEKYKEETQ